MGGLGQEHARQMLRYLRLPAMRFTMNLRRGDVPFRIEGDPGGASALMSMLKPLDERGWDIGMVRDMSTEELLERLGSVGVDIDELRFRELASEHWSSIALADEELLPRVPDVGIDDEDFVWMAAYVLWDRLLPGWQSVEQLDDAMQEGYALLERGDLGGAVARWAEAWTLVKALVEPSITSVREADESLPVRISQSIFNWCQDHRTELHNASLEDPSHVRDLSRFSREFVTRFPDTDGDIILDMRLAEATAHAMMGKMERSEALFEALARDLPEDPWPLIGWGDAYWMHPWPEGRIPSPGDYARAEDLYLRACSEHPTFNELIECRLEDMRKMRDGQERAADDAPS